MPVKAKNYKALTGQGQGEAKNYTLAEMGDLCKDNLLFNSNWKEGIINQKAQSSYIGGSTKKLSIDGWFCINNVSQLGVHEDYINIYNRDSSSLSYVGQSNRQKTEDYLTVAVYVRTLNGTLEARLGYYSNSTFKEKTVTLKEGLNVFTTDEITDEFSQLNFVLNPNSNAYLEYAKVEKGKYFTGMKAWNEDSEILKCYVGFISFYSSTVKRIGFVGNTEMYITYELPIKARKNPTVNFAEKVGYRMHGTNEYKETNITSADVTQMVANALTVRLKGDFGFGSWNVASVENFGVSFDFYNY